MPDVSVVIPYRYLDEHRLRLLAWVRARWEALLPGAQLVLGSCGPGPFNRAEAINEGARRAAGGTLVIADADVVVSRSGLAASLTGPRWSFPFDVYFTMAESWTTAALEADPAGEAPELADEPDPRDYAHRHPGEVAAACESGCLVMPTAMFSEAGGLNELHEGWGYEDRTFAGTMTRLFGPPFRPVANALHLYHDVPAGHDPNSPEAAANRRLYRRLKARGFPVGSR